MWSIIRPDRLQGQPKPLRPELLKRNSVRLDLFVDHDRNRGAIPRGDRIVFEIEGLAGSLAFHRIKDMAPGGSDRFERCIFVRLRLLAGIRDLPCRKLLLKPLVIGDLAPCNGLPHHFPRRA